jgi:hypothetical protein
MRRYGHSTLSYGQLARMQASIGNQFPTPSQFSHHSFHSTSSATGQKTSGAVETVQDRLLKRVLEILPGTAKALSSKFEHEFHNPIMFALKPLANALVKATNFQDVYNGRRRPSATFGYLRDLLEAAFTVEWQRLDNRSGTETMRKACSCAKAATTALCRNTREESYHWTVHKCTCPRPVGPLPTVEFRSYSPDEGSQAIEGYIEMFQRLWKSEEIEGESIFGPPT